MKYTKATLARLEDVFAESDYALRYEKGQFRAGSCVLREQRVVLVNSYFPLEGRINCLIDLLRTLPDLNLSHLTPRSRTLLETLRSPTTAA
ncbi:MAG: hypothetical protein H7330_09185 [Hymenobacteraceae bacterium]|nr:hypothetical protein [Hymenobacteraceae bacterium]